MTDYGRPVSYGIRRCEFDHFLLQRSGVRQTLGEAVVLLERKEGCWIVNGHLRARLLVGAGGHYCPVARLLGAKLGREAAIVAQAAEFAMSPEQERLCRTPAETPELFFCRDMKGYGWLFRKGNFLNIGLGRMDMVNLSRHTGDFCRYLVQRGDLAAGFKAGFQGHAYLLYDHEGGRSCLGDAALLIGDAAGLAHPQSGEGILPAIESALLAADTILAAKGDYRRDNMEPYAEKLAVRFGGGSVRSPSSPVYSRLARFLGAELLSSSWLTRRIVLERWFLQSNHKSA
ncbi:MAG: NAD(P)/FAD-dependent oxidoreductase [Verrucomicrobia bacterium]|nr:NAD(P)/FAD-dependent oxidoreductase [Deltaproteobacteria bacterium]